MQVDLFKNNKVSTESQRLAAQIESRKFSIVQSRLDNFPDSIAGIPDRSVVEYRDRIMGLVSQPRVYDTVGRASCDNLWELELLGLGMYTREWIIHVDFSDALDVVMEQAFGCSREICRSINKYEQISRWLMNYDLDSASENFATLFSDHEVMSKVYMKILGDINDDLSLINLTQDERISNIVFKFYSTLLETVAAMRDYVVAFMKLNVTDDLIYRSKTYSSAILTSDSSFKEKIILCPTNGEPFEVKVRSYKTYEWATEAVVNEISRNSNNR